MLYLYLDESGDLGFDFVNKKPSRFFTVAVVAIQGETVRQRMIKIIRRTLRNKVNTKSKRKRIVQELKGSSTTIDVKKYFYKLIEKETFAIATITLNKKRVFPELFSDKSRVYNWVARTLLDKINFSSAASKITLVLDKSKSKKEIQEFNSYICGQLKGKIDPQTPMVIRHEDSMHDLCVNIPDLFAWGIQRKYEKRDIEWYSLFKEKITFETLYLP